MMNSCKSLRGLPEQGKKKVATQNSVSHHSRAVSDLIMRVATDRNVALPPSICVIESITGICIYGHKHGRIRTYETSLHTIFFVGSFPGVEGIAVSEGRAEGQVCYGNSMSGRLKKNDLMLDEL